MRTANRLWPLNGALVPLDLNLVVLGGNGPITLPLPAFLIEHDHGLVLFDTGLAHQAWDEGRRAVYGELATCSRSSVHWENRLGR